MDRSVIARTAPILMSVLIQFGAIAFATTAAGHAILVDSTPKPGEETVSPAELVLRFNGRIEKRLAYVTLVGGPRNAKIPLVRSDPNAPPDALRFALPALESGVYRAEWKVLSVDGHLTDGVVGFRVVAPASEAPR
jgi:methionine-rich copper-binding protein CopC